MLLRFEEFIKTHEKYFIVGIFLLAFLVRLVYLSEIKHTPFFENLIVDSKAYDSRAVEIAGGDIIGEGVFFQDPLYPYFLGLIYYVFGHNIYIATFIQFILGSINCLLIYFIGKRTFDRQVALIAAVIAAFYNTFIYLEGQIEKTGLSIALVDLALLLILMAKDKAKGVFWLAPGAVIGLCLLTRGNYLLFIPFLILYQFIIYKKDYKKWLLSILFLCLGTFITISPVTIRNYIAGKDFVLTTYGAGPNFYTGNNPYNQTGLYRPPPFVRPKPRYEGLDFTREAERLSGRELKPSEVSSFWTKKTLEFIKENPGAFFTGLAQKFRYFWNHYEIPDNQDFYFFKRYSALLRLKLPSFALIAPLGLLGIFLSLKKWRSTILLYFFVFSYSISVLATFIFARYRLPIVPALIIFAAFSIFWVVEKVRLRQYLKILAALIISTPLFLFINQGLVHDTFTTAYMNLASVYQRQGMSDKAIEAYKDSIKADAQNFKAHHYLGLLYIDLGNTEEAIKQFQESIKINPRFKECHNDLGNTYSSLGLTKKAIEEYEKAIEIDPTFAAVRNNLGTIYEGQNMLSEAKDQFQKAYKEDPGNKIIARNFARVLFKLGNLDETAKVCEKAIKTFPDDFEINYILGASYMKAGRRDEALKYLSTAQNLAADDKQKEELKKLLAE